APAIFAPAALAFLAAIADDGVPVAVGFFLRVGRNLERKRLVVPELRPAVEPETRNADDGELHRKFIALLTARVVRGRLMNGRYLAVRKGGSVEARRVVCVVVEPEADRIFLLHVCVLHDRVANSVRNLRT